MRTLILLCGRPFSGKSTLARRLRADRGAAVVSLDAINLERGLHGGDGLPVAAWARTLEIATGRVADELSAHRVVVVDDTLCFRWLRDAFRAVASASGARPVLVYLDPPPHLLRARLRENERHPLRHGIATPVLEDHLARFESPSEEEDPITLRSPQEIDAWLARFV